MKEVLDNVLEEVLEEEPVIKTEKPTTKLKIVKCDRLNIRSLRTVQSQVIVVLKAGDILETKENFNRPKKGFLEVTSDAFKGTGYALAEYLDVIEE